MGSMLLFYYTGCCSRQDEKFCGGPCSITNHLLLVFVTRLLPLPYSITSHTYSTTSKFMEINY
uniref:Uncharacterized protein n=1 Tax=Populus trichocarpa TaxID=3694 RepID=A0A3N7EXU7_POPTR